LYAGFEPPVAQNMSFCIALPYWVASLGPSKRAGWKIGEPRTSCVRELPFSTPPLDSKRRSTGTITVLTTVLLEPAIGLRPTIV